MNEWNYTASKMFSSANRFIEAYHAVLKPVCRQTGLPPMAVDILMFVANNPENGTAKDICQYRGLKPGIVSVHIDRLVNDGLLTRQSVPGDRRKTQLVCTEKSAEIVEAGHELQRAFAHRLLDGLDEADVEAFRGCLSVLSENIDNIRRNGLSADDRG